MPNVQLKCTSLVLLGVLQHLFKFIDTKFGRVTEIGHFYDNLSGLIHHNNLYKHT